MFTNSVRIARIRRNAWRLTVLLLAVSMTLPTTATATATRTWNGPYGTEDCDRTAERTATGPRMSSLDAGTGSDGEGAVMMQNRLTEQRKAQLKMRLRDRLRERKMQYDRAVEVLSDRIDRIERIAARVEEAGGDVGDVYDLLEEARSLIEESLELEAEARRLFNTIADSDDPRAAFEEALETAIAAVNALRDARSAVRRAAIELADIIAGLLDAK